MTGDVMFHEFIKKSDKKEGIKRKKCIDKDTDIKTEETNIK